MLDSANLQSDSTLLNLHSLVVNPLHHLRARILPFTHKLQHSLCFTQSQANRLGFLDEVDVVNAFLLLPLERRASFLAVPDLEVELVDIVLRESERIPQHDHVLQCERPKGSRATRTVVGVAFGSDKANEDIAPVQAKVVEYLGLSHLEKIA